MNGNNQDKENGKEPAAETHDDQDKRPPLPVDCGWTWFVMLGAFFNICCIMTFIRATSILLIQFLDTYQESAMMTTLAFGFNSSLFAICNILGPTVFLPRFKVRTLAVVGSTLNFLCILGIAFAPNMILIDLLMGILGFAHGLIAVPQMTLIGHYFKKHLSFASAVVNAGLSIGTIAGPPMTQFLLDKYGLQGTILIQAGINMNTIAASLLLRPTSLYAPPEPNAEAQNHFENMNGADSDELDNGSSILKPDSEATAATLLTKNGKHLRSDHQSLMRPHKIRSCSESIPTNTSGMHLKAKPDHFSHSDIQRISQSTSKEHLSKNSVSSFLDSISASSSIKYLSNAYLAPSVFTGHVDRYRHDEEEMISTDDKFHMNETCQSEFIVGKQTNCVSDSSSQKNKVSCLSKLQTSMSKSIYKHPLSIMLLAASGLGIHTQAMIGYMPASGRENGLSDSQIPLLVTITGALDFVSKLGIGVFADLGYVKRSHIVVATQLVAGISVQFIQFCDSFGLMVALQIAFGLTVGIAHAMLGVLVVDCLGLKYMGHILGGYFLINGIITSMDHLVVGYLKDMTNSFLGAYHYMGSLTLLGGIILLLEPLIAKIKPAPQR